MKLPKVHERVLPLQQASDEFSAHFLEVSLKYKLTPSEEFYILSDELRLLAARCVRSEREH